MTRSDRAYPDLDSQRSRAAAGHTCDAGCRSLARTIAASSRELVDAMSDIVWAINPAKDHLSDLTQRMRRMAADAFTASNTSSLSSCPPPIRRSRWAPTCVERCFSSSKRRSTTSSSTRRAARPTSRLPSRRRAAARGPRQRTGLRRRRSERRLRIASLRNRAALCEARSRSFRRLAPAVPSRSISRSLHELVSRGARV